MINVRKGDQEMRYTGKMTSKGQTTIPKEVRDALQLKTGDDLYFSVLDGVVHLTAKNLSFADIAGMLGDPPNGPATLEEIDATILQRAGLAASGNIKPSLEDHAA
jgi:antitoxin PrlF